MASLCFQWPRVEPEFSSEGIKSEMHTKVFIKSGGAGEYTHYHNKDYRSIKKMFSDFVDTLHKDDHLVQLIVNIKNKLEKT